MRFRQILVALALAASLGGASQGCTHNRGDSLVVTGEGKRLDSEAIDRDPLALLPASPVVLFGADAPAFFGSAFGAEIGRILANRIPGAAEAGVVPQRDLRKVVGGVYSFAGADAVAVLQGDFHEDRIKASADQKAGASGSSIVRSQYAGNDLYTMSNVGFTLVTSHTMLVGNETGIRRALDRIRDGRVQRDVPEWMLKLLDQPQASMMVAGDVTGQPMVASMAKRAPFLNGLQSFRVLGNFQPPGLNVAGALTYPDAETASAGEKGVLALAQAASVLSILSVFGLGAPLQSLKTEVKASDVQFVMSVDAQSLARLLAMF